MSPKRLANARSSSPSTDSGVEHARKRIRSSSATSWDETRKVNVYIVQSKIDQLELQELFQLIEASQRKEGGAAQYEQVSDYKDADVIITNIRMKKRFERHVSWEVVKQKPIVTPAWLHQSVKDGHPADCRSSAAIQELYDTTVEHCPTDARQEREQAGMSYLLSANSMIEAKSTSPRVFQNWAAKYACQRASPLVCMNQELALELSVLAKSRELESLAMNALSYEKTVGVSYPNLITRETFDRDIKKLTGLGDKTLFKIQEFLKKGYINESRDIRSSERFRSLSLFTSIYGIGPVTARKLYDLGLRTIEDLERYYDIPSCGTDPDTAFTAGVIEDEMVVLTPNGKSVPPAAMGTGKGPAGDKVLPEVSIKIGLMLRDDLEVPISREEVEEMHRVVMTELEKVQSGCVSTIVGGYRRGKAQSNDVDIVIGHPDLKSGADRVKGLCKRFLRHLHSKGMVTHVMHLSSFHAPNALRTSHRDSLEKALTVFVLPPDGKEDNTEKQRLHRRLDLIFAAPEAYWTAVIGWSGSRLFERDLRSWAKNQKGFKFDSSGLTRRHDSKLFLPRSEQEIFDILGLDWIDPTMRNANV